MEKAIIFERIPEGFQWVTHLVLKEVCPISGEPGRQQLAEIADRIISVEKGRIINVKTSEKKKGGENYETKTI